MSSIIPTVGRKVWFFADRNAAYGRLDPLTPMDATVTYVWGPTVVNLLVIDHNGKAHAETQVTLRDPSPDDRHGRECVATWMPYQMGQAKASA